MDELLREIVELWTPEQIVQHIDKLEARVIETRKVIVELRALLKRKTKKVYEMGERGGK
jgi:HEPN domain-containing protein